MSTDPYRLAAWLRDLAGMPSFDGAACAESATPDAWFPGPSVKVPAWVRQICAACPVRQRCAEYAIPRSSLSGVWGGMSEIERTRIRRRGAA